ncbi:hypothetical protein LR48_Vigan05g085800 [Vigna angularis]|uniref:Transposase (putative) gypsy type domain-containing protein n=1 Tax=Phaseolus angularis TaxID=3914 RepID=A0A0L9UL17_PHAAN|nr:hypothetical protein LR48_Vigan05g085800 [Vigna angularis]
MAAVHIESSSSESSGRVQGGGGGAARGGDEHSASPSLVSLSYLEEIVGSSRSEPASLEGAGGRIVRGIPIFLLKGGIRVYGSPYELDGDGVIVSDWAPYNASLYASQYGTRALLEQRVSRTHIARDVEDSRLIRAGISMRNERVYYGKRSSLDDFFYMYVNVFTQLFVQVSFTEFQMAVLQEANIAPSQLHPNSWAAVQAFLAMCLAVGVTPTILVFFHYFEVRPPPQGGWVSLTSVRDRTLFRPFLDSFKNFKNNYFKTKEPRKIKAYPMRVLGLADLEAVHTINALPRRISARYLVKCLSLEDCEQKASHDDSCTPPIQLYGRQEALRGQFFNGLNKGCTKRSSSSSCEAVFLVRPSTPEAFGNYRRAKAFANFRRAEAFGNYRRAKAFANFRRAEAFGNYRRARALGNQPTWVFTEGKKPSVISKRWYLPNGESLR